MSHFPFYAIITVLSGLLAYALYMIQTLKVLVPTCAPCPIIGPYTPSTPILANVPSSNIVDIRDKAVMQNSLYPPVSRDTRDNTTNILNEPRLFPNRDSSDTFRLVGYLVNRNNKEDVWKLIARMENRHESEFYAESSNRKLDLKVPITPEIAKSADGTSTRPFRDVYDLPDSVHMSHPMFDALAVYDVVQLPRAKLASGYI